jgi:hypothetical protein
MDKESTEWLVGGFIEAGAYGPTILLQLQSLDAVQRLARAFRDTAQGSRSLEIAGEAGVRLDEIPRLELGLDDGIAETRVTRNKDRPGFHWRGSSEGWRTLAQMLEPRSVTSRIGPAATWRPGACQARPASRRLGPG